MHDASNVKRANTIVRVSGMLHARHNRYEYADTQNSDTEIISDLTSSVV